MKCPSCGELDNDTVTDSRPSYDFEVIRRRRKCRDCQHAWTTHEFADIPYVTWTDGTWIPEDNHVHRKPYESDLSRDELGRFIADQNR